MVIFTTAAHALAHNNGCDPFERETFEKPRIQLFRFKEISYP